MRIPSLLFALAAAATAALPLSAQTSAQTGRVVGHVLDAESGRGIAGAQVAVAGTALETRSGLDGRFVLTGVPAGTHTVEVRQIGYSQKTVTNVEVRASGPTTLDVSLSPAVFAVEAIEVTAEVEQGSVSAALQRQRTSVNIVNAISQEQIEKSPDSDASQAVRRVSGVTVQDGRFVFVRGLGERYTQTALNGARLPSPEPEKRLVPLDLFPAGLLESISTSKTFTPDQPGDFSGAQVNLRTREFPARRVFSLSMSAGFNDAVTGQDILEAPTVGSEWLASAGSERELPAEAAAIGRSTAGLSQSELNTIIGSFRNVWSPLPGTGSPTGSFGLSLGGEDPVFGMPLGYVGTFNYGYSQEIRADETLGLVQGSADEVLPRNQQVGQSGTVSAQWGGMLNLTGRLGDATKLSLNTTFNRSADNTAGRWLQNNEEFGEVFQVTRLSFVERQVRSHQLHGEHLLGHANLWEWFGSYSSVSRDEPDRSDLVYETEEVDGERVPVRWWDGARQAATRTFSTIDESAYEGGSSLRLAFGDPGREVAVKFGASWRQVERDADSRAYDITNLGLTARDRERPAEEIFTGPFVEQGLLQLFVNANGGFYTGDDRNLAGFIQTEIPLGSRLRVIAGARLEKSDIEVQALTPLGVDTTAVLDDLDILPAVTVNLALSAYSNLRLSGTQTLARPDFRELAPVTQFDPLGGLVYVGNPQLTRALIQNADLRWEYFPSPGEVFSVSLFAKHFDSPIEQVFVGATGAPRVTWVNAREAVNYGIELEARKSLAFLSPGLLPFTAFANVTLMESDIEPGDSTALTASSRPLVGQAEYVVNGGLSYSSPGGALSITGLYNVVGPRIHQAALLPITFDAVEEERHVVDLSLRWQATPQVGFKLDGKNLLDEPYRIVQGEVVRHQYWSGRSFSAGLSWRP